METPPLITKETLAQLPKVPLKVQPVMCLACYHVWLPKTADPKKCPGCQNYGWDKPRRLPKRNKEAKLNMSPQTAALIRTQYE